MLRPHTRVNDYRTAKNVATPPRHGQYASHRERDQPDLSSPTFAKLAHAARSIFTNERTPRLIIAEFIVSVDHPSHSVSFTRLERGVAQLASWMAPVAASVTGVAKPEEVTGRGSIPLWLSLSCLWHTVV